MITVNIKKDGVLSKTLTAASGDINGRPEGGDLKVDVDLRGVVMEYGHAATFQGVSSGTLIVGGPSDVKAFNGVSFGAVKLHPGNAPTHVDPEEEILHWLGPSTFGVYRAGSERPCACCAGPITKGTKAIRWMNPGRPRGNQREVAHAHCLTEARLRKGAYPSVLKMHVALKTKERCRQDDAVEALVRGGMDRSKAEAATSYDHLTSKEPRSIAEALGEIITPKVGDLVGVMDYRLSNGPVKVGVITEIHSKGGKCESITVMPEDCNITSSPNLLRLIMRDGKPFNFQEYAE